MDNNLTLCEYADLYGYAEYSTIILYGLENNEKLIVKEIVSNMRVYDCDEKNKRKISILDTNDVTDIIAIPNILSIINFDKLSDEDKKLILEYYTESEKPFSNEEIVLGFIDDNFKSVVYCINYKDNNHDIPHCFIMKNKSFENKENLRLSIISTIKDYQGKGTASINSNRIYRVLMMYQYLIKNGRLSKEIVDELIYPEQISTSMFSRDISVIRSIENEKFIYDRNIKEYLIINKLKEK